jgi:hypothetical protein
VSWRGGVSAVGMYALAKHSPLFLRRIFIRPGKPSCSNARAAFAAGSHHLLRWLWGLLRQARLPQSGQHPELSSVLAARSQGQENAGVLRAEGKLLHHALGNAELKFSGSPRQAVLVGCLTNLPHAQTNGSSYCIFTNSVANIELRFQIKGLLSSG